MFTYRRTVLLRETDATGVIYFTTLLDYGVEAFEYFLAKKGNSLKKLLEKGCFFPIVHAEANYKAPLFVGDEIELVLGVKRKGNRSFTLEGQIYKKKCLSHVGVVNITHVFVPKTKDFKRGFLEEILEGLHLSSSTSSGPTSSSP